MQVLRPLPLSRFVYLATGIVYPGVIAFVITSGLIPASVPFDVYAAVSVLYSLVVAVRGFRLAVILGPSSLWVRGLFASREIPRASIRKLVGSPSLPVILWTDVAGRHRKSVLTALGAGSSPLPAVQKHAADNVAALRAWIEHA